jgi:hypothetical protein
VILGVALWREVVRRARQRAGSPAVPQARGGRDVAVMSEPYGKNLRLLKLIRTLGPVAARLPRQPRAHRQQEYEY